MNPTDIQRLNELFSQPTAPFREIHVMRWVLGQLNQHAIPHFLDPLGNIVIGARSKTDYLRLLRETTSEPVRVFIAHMDHPGFHGTRWVKPNVLRVQWYGGSPTQLLHGSRVWLATEAGTLGEGVMQHAKLKREGWAIDTAEIHVADAWPGRRPKADQLFGGFNFRKPVWHRGHKIYTRAADDLAGVFCIVSTARKLFAKPTAIRPPFIGLLTRAEEVGLVGAVGHLELGWLQAAKRSVMCVSLEASRTLPGAVVGKGPIVRLGDRRTPFDQDALQVLTELAQKILPQQHQRRLMDGGACEGSAATAYGLPTIGLAVPLGNYHNQGLEGGPDCRGKHGPAPEFVDQRDIAGQLKLCIGLMRAKLPWRDPWQQVQSRLRRHYRHYKISLG